MSLVETEEDLDEVMRRKKETREIVKEDKDILQALE